MSRKEIKALQRHEGIKMYKHFRKEVKNLSEKLEDALYEDFDKKTINHTIKELKSFMGILKQEFNL